MINSSNPNRVVRICRPAFQDFHLFLPRYRSRSELIRQLLKLRWWNPSDPCVIDLEWNQIPQTDLFELAIEPGFGIAIGLRIVFFEYSPCESEPPCIWVLGGMRQSEKLDDLRTSIYLGRSAIVRERATNLGENNDTQT